MTTTTEVERMIAEAGLAVRQGEETLEQATARLCSDFGSTRVMIAATSMAVTISQMAREADTMVVGR